jgi:hypothetical protein
VRRDGGDRLRRRDAEIGVRLLEIAQGAERLPQPIELADRDRLVAVADLGLKRVRDTNPTSVWCCE